MDAALFCARLVLAGVFAVAGTTKLLDRTGVREALVGFGLPPRLVAPVSWALPVAELLVAISLIPQVSAWWGALAALGLLLAFTAVIARSLARGERPDCRCFGQLHAAPVGWLTLLRNGILGIVAVFVLGAGWSDPGPSAVGWIAVLPPHERPAPSSVSSRCAARRGRRDTDPRARQPDGTPDQPQSDRGPVGRRCAIERPEAVQPDRPSVGAPAPVFTLPASTARRVRSRVSSPTADLSSCSSSHPTATPVRPSCPRSPVGNASTRPLSR